MHTPLAPILRDYLIRFQQTAIKETGRRPMTFLRTSMDESLLLPGCQRPGFAFWQPVPSGGWGQQGSGWIGNTAICSMTGCAVPRSS